MGNKRRSPLKPRADFGWSILILSPRVEPPEGYAHHQHSSQYHQGQETTDCGLCGLRYNHRHFETLNTSFSTQHLIHYNIFMA